MSIDRPKERKETFWRISLIFYMILFYFRLTPGIGQCVPDSATNPDLLVKSAKTSQSLMLDVKKSHGYYSDIQAFLEPVDDCCPSIAKKMS
ncbi:hypothetical protein RCO48_14625 [Peribacillus frigoritolerans]|nr:hypothetical protein [Peribacillus frigoritolerans]